jgi:hypothetical protein
LLEFLNAGRAAAHLNGRAQIKELLSITDILMPAISGDGDEGIWAMAIRPVMVLSARRDATR